MRTTTDFERFYYQKVALAESCGCAEQVIGMHDIDANAREGRSRPTGSRGVLRALIDLFRRRR